jgi:hypothetical protein
VQTQALECGYVRTRTGALNVTSSGSGCKIPMTWQISGDAGVHASTTDVHYLVDGRSNMLGASFRKIKPFIKILNAHVDTAGVFNTRVGVNNTGRLGYGQVLLCIHHGLSRSLTMSELVLLLLIVYKYLIVGYFSSPDVSRDGAVGALSVSGSDISGFCVDL